MRHNQPIPPGKRRFRALPTTLAGLLGLCGLLLLLPATALRAAAPPTIYQAYVTPGNAPIQGGLAVGNSGSLFFATLGASGITPKLIGLNSSHNQLWNPYSLNTGEQVYGSPSVSPDGTKLYLGTDHGRLLCLNTASGALTFSYSVPTADGADRKIRCTPALNFDSSQVGSLTTTGGTVGNQGVVYFHCNTGKLYALNATTGLPITTGAPNWPVNTGNTGGPPGYGHHAETWSSSPVIARADGRIYVGSADGQVYGFDPTGTQTLQVTIGQPMEASLAISCDGWLYGGTREHINYDQNQEGGIVFALDPAAYDSQNPSAAIMWLDAQSGDGAPGLGTGPLAYLASPVIDQRGYVYFPHVLDVIRVYHPTESTFGAPTLLGHWNVEAKLCQTPAINQNGHLFAGGSKYDANGNVQPGRFIAVDLNDVGTPTHPDNFGYHVPEWFQTTNNVGQTFGELLGTVLIRATSTGRVYFADMSGRLFYFNSGSPLMAGCWPGFQGNGRHTGVEGSYPYLLAELPYWYAGQVTVLGGLNSVGHAVGQAYGSYNYPYGNAGYLAARWQSTVLTGYNGPQLIEGSVANAINGSGHVVGSAPAGPGIWPDHGTTPSYLSGLSYFSLSSIKATDINTAGAIIGYGNKSENGVTKVKVLRWTKTETGWGTPTDAGTGPGNYAYAYAISDNGFAVGKARYSVGGPFRAFVTTSQGLVPSQDGFGTFGGSQSEAWDINKESGIVGWAHNVAGKQRAFFVEISSTELDPDVHELPELPGMNSTTYHSAARGVNRLGQVVGKIQNDAGAYRAFVCAVDGSTKTMLDLNNLSLSGGLVPANFGWTLSEAVAISDAGHMMGWGTKSGSYRAWILYPTVIE